MDEWRFEQRRCVRILYMESNCRNAKEVVYVSRRPKEIVEWIQSKQVSFPINRCIGQH